MSVKRVSVEDARSRNSTELWVMNVSEEMTSDSLRDSVFLSIRVGVDEVSVPIQSTWIPQNLAEFVPRDVVLNSPRFLAAVKAGLVAILEDSDAAKYLATPQAQEERQRINDIEAAVREASSAKKLTVEVVGRAETTTAPSLGGTTNSKTSAAPDLGSQLIEVGDLDLSGETLLERLNAASNDKLAADLLKAEMKITKLKRSDLEELVAGLKHAKLKKALESRLME